MTTEEAYIALNMIPKLGPVRLRALLEVFATPQAVLEAGEADLRSVRGVGIEAAQSIRAWRNHADPASELDLAKREGVQVVTLADENYPPQLREIHDPPTVLYVRGNLLERDRVSMGVVGSRKPTHYAGESAKRLSHQLAYAGVTVVSGLARGVDTAAHQGALAAKGRTIAVLGSGLCQLYPPENAELARKIETSGAVVSEYPLQTKADRRTFPMRNRIISGMSFGLLVVEAGTTSGALISANQAGEQGRSLYAIPGRIDNPNAIGSNRLIQQGAKLVMDVQDILDDFQLLFPRQPDLPPPPKPEGLNSAESTIYEAMGSEELFLDELITKTGLPTQEVASTLLALEMRRLVKQLPGSRYVKLL
jgi:DNA processing protein